MSAISSYCDPCSRENASLRYKGTVFCSHCLETLCRVCERHHKKNKASLDHKLIFGIQKASKYVEMKQQLKVMEQTVDILLQKEAIFLNKLEEGIKDEEYCMEKLKSHLDYCFERVKADVLSETSSRRTKLTTASVSQTKSLKILKGNIKRSTEALKNSSGASYRALEKKVLEHTSKVREYEEYTSSQFFTVVESASCLDIYRRIDRCVRIKDETVKLD